MREVDVPTAGSVFSAYDTWLKEVPARASLTPADLAVAASYLRRLNSPLRGPDAVNIALAARIGAELATFDKKMAAAAEVLGVPVAKAP
jgi:predicted nucleic acid-binding protein